MPSASEYGVVFGVAFGVTLIATPLCGRLARRVGVMAEPDEERRVHQVSTPYFGGVAMLIGFLAALWVAHGVDGFSQVFDSSSIPLAVTIGAVIICGVVTIDES